MSKSYKVKLYCFDKASRCADNKASKWSLFWEPTLLVHGWGEGPQAIIRRTASQNFNAFPSYCTQGDGEPRSLVFIRTSSRVTMSSVKTGFRAGSNTIRKIFNMDIVSLVENLLLNQIVVNCKEEYTHTHIYVSIPSKILFFYLNIVDTKCYFSFRCTT